MTNTMIRATVGVSELWLENRRGASGLGIGETRPRVSWIGEAPDGIELSFTDDRGRVQSTHVDADETRLVEWPFEPLSSRAGGILRATPIGDDAGVDVRVEAGLLDRSDWTSDFVSPSPISQQGELRPAYLLRASFALEDVVPDAAIVLHARLYATAHGIMDLELNGSAISDERLAPGWTSYRHRLRYRTHDVTDAIRSGENVIGAWLADGWYRGRIGFDGGLWDVYGPDVALLAQVELTLESGRVVTAPLEWRFAASPVTAAGLYEGESYDARLMPLGWSSPGFDASAWQRATTIPLDDLPARLEAPTGPPVRSVESLRPVSIEPVEGGRLRLDFGQNISGVVRLRPAAPSGHRITVHHAEVIENGRLGVRPLRTAISVDDYVCSGEPDEEWAPRFTIHGFRYAELENWPGGVDTVDVEALVIHTDLERTGWFTSSHAGLDRLHENVVWSMRDNFVDLPTDCPQRDERMGWTGDIQVFMPTALTLFGAQGTLAGWLRDLAAEQSADGDVPNFVPWVECGFPNFPTAAWGDAAVIVPWELYRHDGDPLVLVDQYDSMRGWVDLVDRLTHHTGLWNEGFQLGDWLDPAAPPDKPGDSQTDRHLVATAYHARTARILAEVAHILRRQDDAEHYALIAERAAAAFRAEWVSPSGRVVSDTATSLAVALSFDLLETPEQIDRAGRRLIELVVRDGFHITTGFVGTPLICDALVRAGGADAAYHLLLQDELPSWLYPVSMGATTIWERWDSMLPDGQVNPGDMTSFNHYALGAVADFLHRVVAGLSSVEPGYRRLHIEPVPGGGLTHASASHLSPLGLASSSWRREGRRFHLDIEVPPGATATVVLPDGARLPEVGPGSHTFTCEFRAAGDDPVRPAPRRW